MEKIYDKRAVQLFGVFLLTLCFGYLFFSSRYDKVVEYEVVDSEGGNSVQIWKSRGQKVFFFDEKGVLYASLKYSVLPDLYTENFSMDESMTINQYKKPPEETELNKLVEGGSLYVSSEGVRSEVTLLSSVKTKRGIDGKVIHVTISGEDGNFHITRKLYDENNSTYFLPDEILEEIIANGVTVHTIRYVAKGRKVIPMRYKSGVSL